MILGAVLSSCHGLQVGSGNSGHVESAGQAQADDAEPGEDSEAVGQCRRSGQPSSWHPYLVSTSEVLQHSRSQDEVPGIDGCDHSAPCEQPSSSTNTSTCAEEAADYESGARKQHRAQGHHRQACSGREQREGWIQGDVNMHHRDGKLARGLHMALR